MSKPEIDQKIIEQIKASVPNLSFLILTGAHSFGFPSVDSDFDLRGMFIYQLEDRLQISKIPIPEVLTNEETSSQSQKIGLSTLPKDYDVVIHDIAHYVANIIKPNGNFLEWLHSPFIYFGDESIEEIKGFSNGLISKKLRDHYSSLARKTEEVWKKEGDIKSFLYSARARMITIHALETGLIVPDINELNSYVNVPGIDEFLKIKSAGEYQSIADQSFRQHGSGILQELSAKVDSAYMHSILRDIPDEHSCLELKKYAVDLMIKSR